MEVMKQTEARNLVFTHYDPSYDDNKLTRIKEHYVSDNKNIYMSYEGFEFELI
jgi:ribonuclease BN (tRNA processing enzyme)